MTCVCFCLFEALRPGQQVIYRDFFCRDTTWLYSTSDSPAKNACEGVGSKKQLAVLKRLGRFLSKQGKLVIYNSFIASNFSYCPLAWHFCSVASTNKLEKVQERALRFINDNYSSSINDLLKSTNTQPLHVRRLKQMACEVYKIVNRLSPEYINDLVNIKSSSYNFRAERQAEIPRVNTTRYGLRSFRSEAARVWNSLPNELRVAESYPQFRRLIRSWDSFGCKCPLCST